MLRNQEINGTEEIGLVTPTPGPRLPNEIMAWIMNYIHVKRWDVITRPFSNFNGSLAEPLSRLING